MTITQIQSIIQGFKKVRVQFLQLTHLDATNPIGMDSITGSVKDMKLSKDFHLSFKKKIGLKRLGLWWT